MPDIERIQLAHGGGGRLTRDLIDNEIVSRFGDGPLRGLPDAATLGAISNLVFTTDSFVVQPAIFPGGNIGDLAVHGTVNDLAVSGAKPLWISLAMIIEEGLPLATLREILDAVKRAAAGCGVSVVTGDTKVVGRGQCDGLYLNTAGLGEKLPDFDLSSGAMRPGDHVLTSGTLGEHGLAILAARQGMPIGGDLESDSAPVHRLVAGIAHLATQVAFMRDPTRGGAATVLTELVEKTPYGIDLKESQLPLSRGGRAVCELLGIDPLHVASEGRLLLVCRPGAADAILDLWRQLPEGSGARTIGTVQETTPGQVVLETLMGSRRLVDLPRGELLPRIC